MIHIVYPYGPRAAAPWSIGNHLAAAFTKEGHEVKQYDWEEERTICHLPGDVLVGHPHPSQARVFNLSLEGDWAKRISIAPWNGTQEYTAQIDAVIDRVDRHFAICGPHWRGQWSWKWNSKTTPLDMAFEPEAYPLTKTSFNPVGCRRFLFIGCTLPCKGTSYLEHLIKNTPGAEWGHLGPGTVDGATNLGYVPIETEFGRRLVSNYDFLVMPGSNDANPTTVLEAAGIGLIPLCTSTCGWGGDVRYALTGNLMEDAGFIHQLNYYSEWLLREMQAIVHANSLTYTFDKFCTPVLEAIGGNNA